MRDELEPPSEADGGAAWVASVRSTGRAEVRRAPWWLRVLHGLGLLAAGVLAGIGFFRERSLDLDLGENAPHLGLHGQRLPEVWTCPEGHQHYSIPYWMGGMLVALGVAGLGVFWRRWAMRREIGHVAGAAARPTRSTQSAGATKDDA